MRFAQEGVSHEDFKKVSSVSGSTFPNSSLHACASLLSSSSQSGAGHPVLPFTTTQIYSRRLSGRLRSRRVYRMASASPRTVWYRLRMHDHGTWATGSCRMGGGASSSLPGTFASQSSVPSLIRFARAALVILFWTR